MTDATAGRFTPYQTSDRNFFLLLLATIWAIIFAGFVPDTFDHFTGKHVPYAWIVHVHAAAFVGWLVLLTVQMTLIRTGQTAVHKKLGIAGFGLAVVMTIVGPWAILTMENLEFGTPDGGNPAFLILPLIEMVTFFTLVVAALLNRKDAAAHKRLILLATISLTGAGASRWLGGSIQAVLGGGLVPFFVSHFFANVGLMAAMVTYDLVTRKKVHPALAIGVMFVLTDEVITTLIYHLPAWKPLATHLIGH